MTPHILFAITPHGFGHLAMAAPVINALGQRHHDWRFTLRTTLPADFLTSRIDHPFALQPSADDFGMVQRNALEVDVEKRKALFKQVVTKLVDDSPIVPMGFTPRFFTFRDYVKGFVTNSSGDFQPFIGGLSRAWIDK